MANRLWTPLLLVVTLFLKFAFNFLFMSISLSPPKLSTSFHTAGEEQPKEFGSLFGLLQYTSVTVFSLEQSYFGASVGKINYFNVSGGNITPKI